MEDFEHNGHSTAFGEDSQRISTTDGRDGEEFLNRLCADNGINMRQAFCLYAWFDEHLPMRRGEGGGSDSRSEHFWRRAISEVFTYKGNRAFALECFILALGTATKQPVWFDIIGVRTSVELGERWGVSKANVNKCVRSFQKMLNLPGERSEQSKLKMSEVRKGQLKKG